MAQRCVQGRAVMVDLHAHFGDERVAVGFEQLMAVLDADRVVIEPGDMVCLHTGFADRLLEMRRNPESKDMAAELLHGYGLDP